MNEAGEPYMTAAQLRFEAELDDYYAWERANDPDLFYNYDEVEVDPADCSHGDCSSTAETSIWECDICGDIVPTEQDENGEWWPRYAG